MFGKKKIAPARPDTAMVPWEDLAMPDRVADGGDYYLLDDLYCRSLVVYSLPEWLNMGHFNNVVSLGGVNVSVQFFPYSREEGAKRMGRRMTQVGSQLILAEKAGNTRAIEALEDKYAYLRQLIKDLSLRRNNVIAVQAVINITAPSLLELREKTLKVKDWLKGTGTRTMYGRQLQGFLHGLPMTSVPLPEYHDLTVAGAACLAPFITTDFSHPSGIYFGENLTGTPVFLDPFIGAPYLFGPHMFLMGTTRSGKSATCKCVTARSVAEGIRVVVLDPEREYIKLLQTIGGVFVRFHPDLGEMRFNLFDLEAEYDPYSKSYFVNLAAKQEDVVNIFVTMLALAGEQLSAEDRARMGQAVQAEYASRGITKNPASLYRQADEEGYVGQVPKEMPTISSFIDRLAGEGNERLATILSPFRRGGPQGLFDGQSTVKLADVPLVVFDLFDLTSNYTKTYAMFVMLSWVWEKFVKRQRQQRKRVLVDEAWMFAKHPATAEFLAEMARRGAKHNTSLMLATQSFYEFSTPEGRGILDQCAVKFFLRMKVTEAEALQKMFNLPPGVVKRIATVLQGQGLLMADNDSALVQFRVLPFEWAFAESDPDKAGE